MTERIVKKSFAGLLLAGLLILPPPAISIEIDYAGLLSGGSDVVDANPAKSKETASDPNDARTAEILQLGRVKKNTAVVEAYATTLYRLVLDGSSAIFNRALSYSQTPLINGCTFCQQDVSSSALDSSSDRSASDPFITLADTRQILAETGNQKAQSFNLDGLRLDGAKLLDRLDDLSSKGGGGGGWFGERFRGSAVYILVTLLLLSLIGVGLLLTKWYSKKKTDELDAAADN